MNLRHLSGKKHLKVGQVGLNRHLAQPSSHAVGGSKPSSHLRWIVHRSVRRVFELTYRTAALGYARKVQGHQGEVVKGGARVILYVQNGGEIPGGGSTGDFVGKADRSFGKLDRIPRHIRVVGSKTLGREGAARGGKRGLHQGGGVSQATDLYGDDAQRKRGAGGLNRSGSGYDRSAATRQSAGQEENR